MSLQHRDRVEQRVDREQLDAVDQRRFARIGSRYDALAQARVARPDHHRQNTSHGSQRAVERELSQCDELLEREAIYLLVDCEKRECHRQVKRRAHLANIRRCEVDEDLAGREAATGVHDRRADAVPRLAEGAVGQADNRECGCARRAIGFDANDVAVDAVHRGGESESERNRPPSVYHPECAGPLPDQEKRSCMNPKTAAGLPKERLRQSRVYSNSMLAGLRLRAGSSAA